MSDEPITTTEIPVSRIQQILSITQECELTKELGRFEDSIRSIALPLIKLLALDVRAENIAEITSHMMSVERWRERICRWHSLAKTFSEHTKSDHFLVRRVDGGKTTEMDRSAYQKRLGAGFIGLEVYLENLIKCIDSRCNACKILVRSDV
jgi:hypothetical protein